ncbi:MAG: hypothetical protein WCR71_06000 [Bacteroidales bacterium]
MKTLNKVTLIIALFLVVGVTISCNQSANKKREAKSAADSIEVAQIRNERILEAKLFMQKELDSMYLRIDKLDENDPDFAQKLDKELEEFQANMDNLNNQLREDGYEFDKEVKKEYESWKESSKELKNKVTKWLDKAGDNIDELGKDVKRNFKEFKESFKKEDK